jgi:hypothetical protein
MHPVQSAILRDCSDKDRLLTTKSRPFGRSAKHPETGRFTTSQQARFTIFDGPFWETAAYQPCRPVG